ncbi:MAG TPA: Na/Pi cotransporter family protein [Paraburkholderia sp.]|uniref:Na/Pi cotransporter family protein n=1 Tax=Paraburkholderia sp. TaxID=1926495 RepID=UPI002B4730C0|nr:Na/Pi cotransporter family protein [Paraburkholderia sp.]HKR46829.1 Na/Pi cotransporter family protein [Paraburkholderia sp.]
MILIVLHLAGGVALLTWGLHMVESGLMRAFGASLRRFMARSLGNRFNAFCAGLAITGALQSSTATGMIASSFAARGLMGAVTGLAVMLGANVGSTLIVQAFSLDLSWISPACLLIGMALFERGKGSRNRDIGRASIGLGLMLLALTLLVSTVQPAETAPALRTVLGALSGEPVLNAALACVLTWAAHSSIPVVLFVMSLARLHTVPLDIAIAMVLGANVGSALNPYFEAAKGDDLSRRRLPAGNLLLRGGVCVLLLAVCSPLARLLDTLPGDASRTIADFHTGLNVAIAVVFIGLLDPVARLLERMMPSPAAGDDACSPRYLDESALQSPPLALACAAREVIRMSEIVEAMLRESVPVLLANDRRAVSDIASRDDTVDVLHDAIKRYVTELTREPLSEEDRRWASDIMTAVINLEHIGDIIDRNLLEIAQKKIKLQLSFSAEGTEELRMLHDSVIDSFRRAQALLVSGRTQTAAQLIADKQALRQLERSTRERHLERLREGQPDSLASSSLHLDVLRDLVRIQSHICALAYPLLERDKAEEAAAQI